MASKYKYKAFISYRHSPEDIKVAEHLNDAIERYHIPKPIRESVGFDGNMDIFRDKNDLPVTDSLNDTIAAALRESEYLIVICMLQRFILNIKVCFIIIKIIQYI